jgi:hypothetical protein
MSLDLNKTRNVDGTFDPSYKEWQGVASSGSSTKPFFKFGVSNSVVVDGTVTELQPGYSQDFIHWFERGGDFSMAQVAAGTLDFGREDVESDDTYKQTQAGQITRTTTFNIKPTDDSKLVTFMRMLQHNDNLGNFNGKLLQAYSNGGFHYKSGVNHLDKGFTISEVVLNAKVGSLPDFAHGSDSESEYAFELLIETSPLTEITGNFESGYGLGDSGITSSASPSITSTTTDWNIKPNLTIVDPKGVLTKGVNVGAVPKYLVQVINTTKGVSTIAEGSYDSGSGGTLLFPKAKASAGDKLVLRYYYFLSPSFIVAAKEAKLTVA